MYDNPLLRGSRPSKTGSGVVVDLPDHEVRWWQEVQLASITSCKAECIGSGRVPGSGGGPVIVIVDPSLLDDPKLLFDKNAGWSRYVSATKPELQNELGLLRDDLPGLQMTVSVDSPEFLRLER